MALLISGETPLPVQAAAPTGPSMEDRMTKDIRKELLTMPFQVIRPTLKSLAENRVAQHPTMIGSA